MILQLYIVGAFGSHDVGYEDVQVLIKEGIKKRSIKVKSTWRTKAE